MPDYTDEEYDAMDEYYTKNPPKVSGDGKSGFFVKHKGNIVIVDDLSADGSTAAERTTPEVIVGRVAREEIA
jgi:adenine/guanine phosphoribosyltransferase-like PRPP-binding protein